MAKYYAWNGSVAFGAPLYPGDSIIEIRVVRVDETPANAVLKGDANGILSMNNPFELQNNEGKIKFYARRGYYNITAKRGNFSANFENVYIGPHYRDKINKTESFTLSEDDDYTWIETTGDGDITITIPAGELSDNFDICGTHYGTGKLTIEVEDPAILVYPSVFTKDIAKFGTWGLTKAKSITDEETFVLFGTQELST